MELAAEDLRFEDAARYRDQLSSIEKIQEKQRMVTQRGDLDVLGLAVDTSMACVQLLFIRGGRLLGRENYFVQHDGDSAETIMTDFIKQYYGDTNFIPKELLLPMDSTDRDCYVNGLRSLRSECRRICATAWL